MSAGAAEVYSHTDGLMRSLSTPGNAVKMLDALLPVVRTERHPLLLARLVVAAAGVASEADGRARVDALIAAAAKAPDDVIAQFAAGVAVHYRGHVRGGSRAEKSADYKRAIALLEPVADELAASPRLWIYLAVSYIRTGRQEDAQAAIAKAVAADSGDDADVYYCRAEVYHRTEPKQALADIDRYIAVMTRNQATGAFSAPGKEQKVRKMRAFMQRVVDGEEEPGTLELFDPIRSSAGPPPFDPIPWALGALGLAWLAVLGRWWWSRRRT